MPRLVIGRPSIFRLPIPARNRRICPICSLARASPPSKRPRTQQLQQHRIRAQNQSTLPSTSAADAPLASVSTDPRIELQNALVDLQVHATNFVNISRLQLAIRGLEQVAGQETIRIAILGLADGGSSLQKAKELLRLLIVDPLKTEEEWERILVNSQQGKPVLIKVGHSGMDDNGYGSRLVQELHVSSPILNRHKLEILVLEMDLPEEGSFIDAVMVPTIEIPTSSTGRYTPVTTPVHKSLIVADGILGAASVLDHPSGVDREIVGAAVDLQIGTPEERAALPFRTVDIRLGSKALQMFRKSVDNALEYEKSWFASGIPEIQEWLESGTASIEGAMKPPVRSLIESLIQTTHAAIAAEEYRRLNVALSTKVASADIQSLRQQLSQWAERAHTELRDQLDIAFNGQRWRKLGWWKLFWRVDDVSMISTDILNQRFLPEAEKEIIFFSGQIAESGITKVDPEAAPKDWAYKPVDEKAPEAKFGFEPPPPILGDLLEPLKDHLPVKIKDRPWPLHIPATRTYLVQETVPTLQALAQKLVLQTLSTSSLASVFAGLMYISSVSTGIYESGAVAALGIVWSLRRMQGKWETARKFWEGEVREEGRKAVRGVEGVVRDVLVTSQPRLESDAELENARGAVYRAEAALAASK
jgi:hypothetical protein